MNLTYRQPGLLTGSIIFFSSSIVVFLSRFATSIIVSRALGVEGKGEYTLIITINGLLILFLDLGLNSSIRYLVSGKQYAPEEIFNFALLISITLSALGGFFFYTLYSGFFSHNILAGVEIKYIILLVLFLPLNLFTHFSSAIVLGLSKIGQYNLVNISRVISNLILQGIAFELGAGISGAVWSWIIANFLSSLLVIWLLRRDIHLTYRWRVQLIRTSFSYGIKAYLANLLTFFNYRLDTFLVNMFSGLASVGWYSISVSTAELIWYVPNSISEPLFLKSAADKSQTISKKTAQICRQTLIVILPITVLFALGGSFLIPWLYGSAFQEAVVPFILLLPGIVGITTSKILFANLSGSGKPQYATFTAAITICFTVILDIVLIPWLDIIGAAIASSTAYLLGSILSLHWFSRETHIPWSKVVIPDTHDFKYIVRVATVTLRETYSKIRFAGKKPREP
jgi:O-antigen/teichoic acid export membrane protein